MAKTGSSSPADFPTKPVENVVKSPTELGPTRPKGN